MTHHTKFKEARQSAGLSVKDAAKLLATHPVTIRRYEMDPETTNTARTAPPLTLKVLDWYRRKIAPKLP